MATATYSKVNDAIESMMNAADMDADTLAYAFSVTAPASETSNPLNDNNGILSNVTQIAYTFWTDSLATDRQLASVTSTQTGGVWTLDHEDWTITASGGAIAGFRYPYLFNQTATAPLDFLIANWDYGSTLTLNDTDTANMNVNASGIMSIT